MGIVRSISFFGIVCITYLLSLFANLNSPDWDGWLGFFGSIFGSIIAILGVYWQVSVQAKKAKEDAKQQQDLLRKQLNNEKENQYRQARPFFIVSKELIDPQERNKESISCIYSTFYRSEVPYSILGLTHIVINNVSKRDMYAVKVLVSTSTDDNFKQEFQKYSSAAALKSDEFYKSCISIDKIAANEKVGLLFDHYNEIEQVWIWYITEMRESIKLYFENENGGLIYRPDEKRLENQQKDGSANYDLSDFEETNRLSDEY
ncbi:hypothetical protein NHN12_03095 [Lactiplantibacillus plantarum]|uniref:hypothetical protein n=1 Tax=Lactiplantibacillus plantarum TaxID=1590 RepID=UPI0020A19D2C|nr:hypothetical protein [Lactiplantibacillus plantarum]USZ61391.1 hypothetical protein NHN12_03095 [Lactiplantibacillus plantarum]